MGIIINEIVGIVVCCVFPVVLVLLLVTSSIFSHVSSRDRKILAELQVTLQKEYFYIIPFLKKNWSLLVVAIMIECIGICFFYVTLFDIILCFIFGVGSLYMYFSVQKNDYIDTNKGIFPRGSFVYRLSLLFFLLIYIGATFAPLLIKNPMIEINSSFVVRKIYKQSMSENSIH